MYVQNTSKTLLNAPRMYEYMNICLYTCIHVCVYTCKYMFMLCVCMHYVLMYLSLLTFIVCLYLPNYHSDENQRTNCKSNRFTEISTTFLSYSLIPTYFPVIACAPTLLTRLQNWCIFTSHFMFVLTIWLELCNCITMYIHFSKYEHVSSNGCNACSKSGPF